MDDKVMELLSGADEETRAGRFRVATNRRRIDQRTQPKDELRDQSSHAKKSALSLVGRFLALVRRMQPWLVASEGQREKWWRGMYEAAAKGIDPEKYVEEVVK